MIGPLQQKSWGRLKPPLSTTFALGDPLAAGLTNYIPMWEGGGDMIRDIVARRTLDSNGTAAFGAAKNGIGTKYSGNNGDGWSYSSSLAPPSPNLFTFACLLKTRATSRQMIWGCNNLADGFRFEINNSGIGSFGASINGTIIAYTAASLFSTNEWVFLVYTKNGAGTNNALYLNGYPQSLATDGSRTYASSVSIKTVGSTTPTGGTVNFNGEMEWLGFWNRILLPSEIRELYLNPYNIFNPPRSFVFYGPALVDLTQSVSDTISFSDYIALGHGLITPPDTLSQADAINLGTGLRVGDDANNLADFVPSIGIGLQTGDQLSMADNVSMPFRAAAPHDTIVIIPARPNTNCTVWWSAGNQCT